MRVGIVGAGIAGLSAARSLRGNGYEVVVFEKSKGPGGRIATRRVGPYTFDTGATSIAPRGGPLEAVIQGELDSGELVLIQKPIYVHNGLRVSPGSVTKNATPRYTYLKGNNTLPKLLSADVDVRYGKLVEEIESEGDRYLIQGELFDRLILTPPIPQSAAILWSVGESRPFAYCRYRSCLSVLLGYDKPLPPVAYHAIIDPEQRHPLTWLSLESEKSPERCPEGHTAMVAQLSPAYSLSHYALDDDRVISDTVDYIQRLYGDDWGSPVATDVKRWKYSLPDSTALFETVNQPRSKIVVAGDGVSAGRVESAYESGLKAARMLMEEE